MKKLYKFMKKILIIIALVLIANPTYAVVTSRASSFSSTRVYTPSYRPSTSYSSSFRSSTPKTSNYSSTSSRTYSTGSSYYNPMNTVLLFYVLSQNNRTQAEIEELKKVAEKRGYDAKGNWYYTKEGFDINGFRPNGEWWYDNQGYDVNGYNFNGINRDGKKYTATID